MLEIDFFKKEKEIFIKLFSEKDSLLIELMTDL